jgi:mannose-6-phosphate isomerase-like protein (cupin superfamily)
MPRTQTVVPARDGLIVVPPGGGKSVRRRFGEQTVVTVNATDTYGAYAVRENVAPAGYSAVPFHIHHGAEEAFYVLEGAMTVTTPDRAVTAQAGSFVLIPRGTVHAFANHEAAPLRWLTFISPGWVSAWIEEESALLEESGTQEPDVARQEAIYAKYGLEIVAPPPRAPAIGQSGNNRS